MTRMWNQGTDLFTMQQNIKSIIHKSMRINVRMVDVIELTYEDFELIYNKIRCIKGAEEIERYGVSIITAWVASYKYGKQDMVNDILEGIFRNLPQHQTKYVMESITTIFFDYQIDSFGYQIMRLEDLREIVARHAGWKN